MKKKISLFLVIAIVIALTGCSTFSAEQEAQIQSLNDRAVDLYKRAVVFVDGLDMTSEQRAEAQELKAETEILYAEAVKLFGVNSQVARNLEKVLVILGDLLL